MTDSEIDFARLLREAQRGDRKSLQVLCTELERIMRFYLVKKFHDPDIVDDLAQEIQLRLLKNIPKIKAPMRLKNFVLKVAFHVTQDYFRQKYRRSEYHFSGRVVSGEDIQGVYHHSDVHRSDSDYVLSKVDVERAMEKLPEKTQRILQLKAEGYKYEEIAEMLEISLSGVKMQIKRGTEKLKKSIFNVTFWVLETIILLE